MSISNSYSPADWYWQIMGQPDQVWSSSRLTWVTNADADYQAWAAISGHSASTIRDAADLGGVMMNQWLPQVLTAGVAVQSSGTPALSATYSLDPNAPPSRPGLAAITGISTGIASGKPLPGGGSTFNYADISGTAHEFSAANFQNLASALENYVYLLTQAVGVLVGGGSASPPSQPVVIA